MPSVNPPKFDGLNSITAANNTIGVRSPAGAGAASQSITAGDYFIHSHTGGGDTSQLVELLDAAIEATHGGGNVAVTVSDTTGRVTITNNHVANTLQVDWTETGLRDLLGFTGANTGSIAANGGSVTGTNAHYNGWYPNVPPSDLLGDPDLVGLLVSDAAVTIAPSGRVVTTKFFEHTLQSLWFQHLLAAYCVPTDSTIVSYQQFWQRILSAGARFRYYPDRTDRNGPAGAGPFTYVAADSTAQDGSTALERVVQARADRYNLRLDLRLFVA